jgi:hypothetical protein
MTETTDILGLLARANELAGNPEQEYDFREFLKGSGLVRIHDYETMGVRPVGTYDCGSVRLKDSAKSLYRAMFLFAPERVSFKEMYKGNLLTLVAPDYNLVASVEFYKYELAVYFSASKDHVEGRGSGVICGLPGSDNGVRFKGEIAQAWFGLIAGVLDREWMVYGGNDFAV